MIDFFDQFPDDIERYEWLTQVRDWLQRHQSDPPQAWWHEDSHEMYLCNPCLNREFPNAELGSDTGWAGEEDEGVRICGVCGIILAYELIGCGTRSELEHFLDAGFDYQNSDHCYQIGRIIIALENPDGVTDLPQYRQLLTILANGQNRPDAMFVQEAHGATS